MSAYKCNSYILRIISVCVVLFKPTFAQAIRGRRAMEADSWLVPYDDDKWIDRYYLSWDHKCPDDISCTNTFRETRLKQMKTFRDRVVLQSLMAAHLLTDHNDRYGSMEIAMRRVDEYCERNPGCIGRWKETFADRELVREAAAARAAARAGHSSDEDETRDTAGLPKLPKFSEVKAEVDKKQALRVVLDDEGNQVDEQPAQIPRAAKSICGPPKGKATAMKASASKPHVEPKSQGAVQAAAAKHAATTAAAAEPPAKRLKDAAKHLLQLQQDLAASAAKLSKNAKNCHDVMTPIMALVSSVNQSCHIIHTNAEHLKSEIEAAA